MRFSKAYIPTTKETPNDAVLASHILLSKAGFIAQAASGLYNYLPLGLKVLQNIQNVVRQELEKAGAIEVNLSFVTPATLWEESGRLGKFGKELLRFNDRKENPFVLGATHEEMMVNIVRNKVTSYKQLPLNLYQISSKFRDEARPRFGLMRAREFLMKDGYSFHATIEDMQREFDLMEETYKKILTRLGLTFRVVQADSGAIGGSGSKEVMVLANSGEDTLVVCESCDYAANVEAAVRKAPEHSTAQKSSVQKVHTPNVTSIDEVAQFLDVAPSQTIKAVAKVALFEDESTRLVLFFMRGDDSLQEVKAARSIHASMLLDANSQTLEQAGLIEGFIGPKDFQDLLVVYDDALQYAVNMVCGANERDYHLVGFDISTVNDAQFFDIISVRPGDSCSVCGGTLSHTKGIECGHIFQLQDTYSKPLGANFLDQNGKSTPLIMGTYGLGVSRIMAAIIEQHHDDKGCKWTLQSAPYLVDVMVSNTKDEAQRKAGETLYEALMDANISTMLDDRKERFGFKIKDAELIGFPFIVIVGKLLEESKVEIVHRSDDTKHVVLLQDALTHLKEHIT